MIGNTGQIDSGGKSRWSLVARAVLAVGGPALGWLGGGRWASEHPLLALLLVALYEALVFCFQIVGDIWKRLKDRWLDVAAQWVDYRVQELVSGYRRKYVEHVSYECRDFDVKGLSTQGTYTLELQRVFVELSVDPRPLHQTSQDPIAKLPERLRQGRHDIWEYLAVGRNLALLGPPGSGKTTLLRHIALVLALRRTHPNAKGAPQRLPILLFLRSHARDIAAHRELPLAEGV